MKNSVLARNLLRDILDDIAMRMDAKNRRKICSKFLQLIDAKRKIREDMKHDAGSID